MKSFFLMLSFFTRLPVPTVDFTEERYIKGIKMIPFVGIVLGLILYAVSFVHLIFEPAVTALILLCTYIVMTGGLHLDGLADTCDGIFSGRERERILEIMKDSRIGSFGVLAMLFFVAFYMVMYQCVPYVVLLIMPIVGKSAPLISASMADYARPSGMGQMLVENIKTPELIAAVALPFAAATLLRDPITIVACAVAELSVVLCTLKVRKVLGGVTGDTHGMVCEVSQMVFIFTVYIGQRIPLLFL